MSSIGCEIWHVTRYRLWSSVFLRRSLSTFFVTSSQRSLTLQWRTVKRACRSYISLHLRHWWLLYYWVLIDFRRAATKSCWGMYECDIYGVVVLYMYTLSCRQNVLACIYSTCTSVRACAFSCTFAYLRQFLLAYIQYVYLLTSVFHWLYIPKFNWQQDILITVTVFQSIVHMER